MIAESVFSLDKNSVVKVLSTLNLEFDATADLEELQAIAYSFISSIDTFNQTYELCLLCGESFDLVHSILDSNNNCITKEVVDQLIELQPEIAAKIVDVYVSRNIGFKFKPSTKALLEDNLFVVENLDNDPNILLWKDNKICFSEIISPPNTVTLNTTRSSVVQVVSSTMNTVGVNVLPLSSFGVHDYEVHLVREITITTPSTVSAEHTATTDTTCDATKIVACNPTNTSISRTSTISETAILTESINVTSPVYEFVTALDRMFDALHWSWEPSSWCEGLENSLFELLVGVSDDLVALVRQWKAMMVMMGGGGNNNPSEDMEHMLETIQNDVRLALVDHNSYSVGRLHQSLAQFTELSSSGLLSIPEVFTNAVNHFVREKLLGSQQEHLQLALMKLIIAAKLHYNELTTASVTSSSSSSHLNNDINKLLRFLSVFHERLQRIEALFGKDRLRTAVLAEDVDERLSALIRDMSRAAHGAAISATAASVTVSGDASSAEDTSGTSVSALSSTTAVAISSATSSSSVSPLLLTPEQLQAITALKPTSMEMLVNQSVSTWSPTRISHMVTLPLEGIENIDSLDLIVRQQSETLFSEVMNVGIMLGYCIDKSTNLARSCAIIIRLLESGLAYVTSETGKIMALFPTKRSILHLGLLGDRHSPIYTEVDKSTTVLSSKKSTSKGSKKAGSKAEGKASDLNGGFRLPVQLAKRLHEMPRIFRMKVHKQLSLRLNTDIPLALRKLREHHGEDCWVGAELEAVWMCMAATTPPKLLVFKLFYGEELIAADFGHTMNGGLSVYIATRFFNRETLEIKTLMPGFLLALVECKVLQQLGCELWDLGGVNLCPLMRYKLDLTGTPVERPEALYEHNRLRRMCEAQHSGANSTCTGGSKSSSSPVAVGMQSLKAGVLVENISLNDLLGYQC